MGFQPTTGTETLKLRLGFVALADMTAGSAAVSAPGMAFTAADIGNPAMMLAAGADGLDPLITTVASVTDADHATLADAAVTSASEVSLIVFRAAGTVSGSLHYNTSLTVFATASFTMITLPANRPKTGQPVLIQDSDFGDLFGGSIDQVTRTNLPGSDQVQCDCLVVGYEKLAGKRTTGELTDDATQNPNAGSFSDLPAGQVIEYLVRHALGADGITVDAIDGPNINFSARYEMCDSAFDRICEICSNETDKYFWYVDSWRKVHFAKQDSTAAPWNVQASDGSDGNVLVQVSDTDSREKYVNRAFVDMGQYIGTADTETFPGDGTTQEFSLQRGIAMLPVIKVDDEAKSVGILNVDPAGSKDWYYNLGSNVVTQDPGATPLTSSDTLQVTYQGYTTAITMYQNDAAVDERAGVEGGTGYYEAVFTTSDPMGFTDGQKLAESIARAFGKIPQKIQIKTYRGGLAVGQYFSVDLPDISASGSYLIDSVTLITEGNRKLWTATATNGPLVADWRRAVGGGGGGSVTNTDNSAAGRGPFRRTFLVKDATPRQPAGDYVCSYGAEIKQMSTIRRIIATPGRNTMTEDLQVRFRIVYPDLSWHVIGTFTLPMAATIPVAFTSFEWAQLPDLGTIIPDIMAGDGSKNVDGVASFDIEWVGRGAGQATAPGAGFQGEWDSGTTYVTDDMVTQDNKLYISLKDDNLNHSPAGSPDWWGFVLQGVAGQGFTERGAWSSGTTYSPYDVVSYLGSSYVAILAGTNHQPDTATSYWTLLAAKGDQGDAILTAVGDLHTAHLAGSPPAVADTRLPVGADGQILMADSTQSTGLKWTSPPSGGGGAGNMNFRGAWLSGGGGTAYAEGDVVLYAGGLYICANAGTSATPGAGGSTHAYWRVYITACGLSGRWPTCAELEMRATPGGTNLATGGTAIGSSDNSGHEKDKAFDGNTSTYWLAGGAPNQWIGYHFGSAVSITELTYTSASTFGSSDVTESPTAFSLDYSDDGSSWTTLTSFTTTWSAPAGGTKIFDVATDWILLSGS